MPSRRTSSGGSRVSVRSTAITQCSNGRLPNSASAPKLNDTEKANKYPKDAVHPVIRTHPVTRRKCIYVCEGYTTRILDIPETESDELLHLLFMPSSVPWLSPSGAMGWGRCFRSLN